MKRGFVSTAIAALALAAIIISITASLSQNSADRSALEALQASSASERADDAQAFLASSLDDAIVDSAWSACGCSSSNASGFVPELQNRSTAYLNGASVLLSSDGLTIPQHIFSLVSSPVSISSCNTTGLVITSAYTLVVSGNSARVSRPVTMTRTVDLYKDSSHVQYNITPTGAGVPTSITVSC